MSDKDTERLVDANKLIDQIEWDADHERICKTAKGYFIQAINNQSIVQRTNEWIPCSERLPEDAYSCIVTILEDDPITFDEVPVVLEYFVGYDKDSGTWNDENGEPIPEKVIAWMKAPYKPYYGGID